MLSFLFYSLMQQRQGPAFVFFERQFNIGLKLLKNILLWVNLLSTETLKHITLTCLINRYLLVGLACLLSVVTPKSSEEKPSMPNSQFTTGLLVDQSGSLAFRDAVQKLKSIVDLLPREWLRSSIPLKKQNDSDDDFDNDKDDGSSAKSSAAVPDSLGQIKRFLTQLLENIPPTRMYVDAPGQIDVQVIER
ncbi:GC-rich sequence DNA-binding factor [Schistosoma japonicum]|nr:GC-rich sequence DNA-binding factor [Schistosoma japonicum]